MDPAQSHNHARDHLVILDALRKRLAGEQASLRVRFTVKGARQQRGEYIGHRLNKRKGITLNVLYPETLWKIFPWFSTQAVLIKVYPWTDDLRLVDCYLYLENPELEKICVDLLRELSTTQDIASHLTCLGLKGEHRQRWIFPTYAHSNLVVSDLLRSLRQRPPEQ